MLIDKNLKNPYSLLGGWCQGREIDSLCGKNSFQSHLFSKSNVKCLTLKNANVTISLSMSNFIKPFKRANYVKCHNLKTPKVKCQNVVYQGPTNKDHRSDVNDGWCYMLKY